MIRRAIAPSTCRSLINASGAEASGRTAARASSSVTRNTSKGSVSTSSRDATVPVTYT
jgi:hypothetical protein